MTNNKKIVLSGIRATGNLHLGNYFGALGKFVRMQDDFDCRFFIADLHALTTHPDPKALHENVKSILAEYLAAGLDPEKNILYVQSDVPEISEMYLLMNMHAGIGELMRTASFKDKARKALGISVKENESEEEIEKEIIGNQSGKSVNAGLLTYPTLMAVDILIHKADFVPVGKDQEQHLELTRRFGRRFNSFYKTDYFHDAVNFNFDGKPVKVPGLDGSGKDGQERGQLHLSDRRREDPAQEGDEGGDRCRPYGGELRAYRARCEPVHAHGAGERALHAGAFQEGVRRLLHPLWRPEEAAGRGYIEDHASHT